MMDEDLPPYLPTYLPTYHQMVSQDIEAEDLERFLQRFGTLRVIKTVGFVTAEEVYALLQPHLTTLSEAKKEIAATAAAALGR